ncbi:hypothetical protein [Lacinutrix himadriensis]|uniref:hypothetical protein n=1 Tax=Lacinutrix himadriensis TaxID=641549 RepID=UPI0006E2AA08|nr:hypothetical protein [Lacinutrix himadriensis]
MELGKTYFTNRDQELPRAIRELTENESKEIKQANDILHEFDYFQRRLLEIQLNKDDYFRTVERYQKLYQEDEESSSLGYDYKRKGFVDINRAFINYISCFKSFVEHMFNDLESKNGKSSDKYKEFTKFTNDLYDGYLSYRLLIRLRDFALHRRYPIQSVHYDREIIKDDKYDYKVKVQFNKSVFLSNTKLNKIFSKDFEAYGELFYVEPFVNELMPIIERLFKKYVSITEDYFIESADLINALFKESGTENIGTTIIEMDGSLAKHSTKIIPVQMSLDFYQCLDKS